MKKIFSLTDEFQNREQLILRDHLALERTRLANERTLFSYIRTALYLLTAGIGILQIDSVRHLVVLAWGSMIVSVAIFCIGFWRFYQLKRNLKTYYTTNDTPVNKEPPDAPGCYIQS